jgi:hypothetical protein
MEFDIMKQRLFISAVVMCAACGKDPEIGPVPPSEVPPTETVVPGNESGSRLRRIDRVGADGSREFAGWYDSERDEDCLFNRFPWMPSTIRRCLPAMNEFYVADPPRFLDESCTRAVGREIQSDGHGRSGNPLKVYSIAVFDSTTGGYVRVFQHGEVVAELSSPTPVNRQFYRITGITDSGVTCALSNPEETRGDWVDLSEVSFNEFVAWTEEVD